MALIKYMGSSDERVLEADETWGGRLAEPLGVRLVWDWDNNHVIDTESDELKGKVSEEALALLVAEPGFKDVTDLKRIPMNDAVKMWKAGKEDASLETVNAVVASGSAGDSNAGEAASGTAGTTTTGGTTSGRRGRGTSGD